MKNIKLVTSVEDIFPDAGGRMLADRVIDDLPVDTTTIAQAIDAWEAEYFRVTGKSPLRERRK